MTYDELTMDIPLAATTKKSDDNSNINNNNNYNTTNNTTTTTRRKGKMSSYSFLERRVQLSSALARHSKSISHITALVASYLPQSANEKGTASFNMSSHKSYRLMHPSSVVPNEFELTEITQLVSSVLQHVHKTWVNADEAQDALFVYHGTLWHSRNHPHDVLGAMNILAGPTQGCWTDLPRDIDLALDAYSVSVERGYNRKDTVERLQSVVRRKMVLGEIGMCRMEQNNSSFRWNMLLEQDGTVLRLTYGAPYNSTSSTRASVNYPIEARVTILSEQTDTLPPWTLLSIRVLISPKTGESNHQLELSSDQMFQFHKLCALTMNQEEVNALKSKEGRVARPLERLLEMSHIFSISWQMDILSCQADALRKGSWSSSSGGSSSSSGSAMESGIEVTPVSFSDLEPYCGVNNSSDQPKDGDANSSLVERRPLATLAIHFWSVDDRYGSPKMGNLTAPTDDTTHSISKPSDDNSTTTTTSQSQPPIRNTIINSNKPGKSRRLTLEIRAVAKVGLEVSLSGGNSVMNLLQNDDHKSSTNNTKHLRRSVDKLLSSLQDPFQLSTSDALLSATVICAELRCQSLVAALHRAQDSGLLADQASVLPPWIHLSVECGSICIAVSLSYDDDKTDRTTKEDNQQQQQPHSPNPQQRAPVLVFRLACDSRTGRYVASFPRSATLIRKLACNDPTASDVQLLRQAKFAELQSSSSGSSSARRRNAAGKDLTGRAVRDAFENLTRSVDTLGRRVGVGEDWEDVGKDKVALREKAIMQSCRDVRNSLMTCAGMSAVFGVAALAIGVAGGVNAVVDMAGGPVKLKNRPPLLAIPPLSIITCQKMVEYSIINGNGESETAMRIEKELCGVSCSFSHEMLTLHLLDITTRLESAMGVTERMRCELLPIEIENDVDECAVIQAKKRIRLDDNGSSVNIGVSHSCKIHPMFGEVQYLALRLNATWNMMHD